jgi:hypothetical protein
MVTVMAVLVLGGLGGAWLARQYPEHARSPAVLETLPPQTMVDLEIPVYTPKGTSTLKAAFAVPFGVDELRVYGGFAYDTPSQLIVGEEAIIHLRTGNARGMKKVRLWEKK